MKLGVIITKVLVLTQKNQYIICVTVDNRLRSRSSIELETHKFSDF